MQYFITALVTYFACDGATAGRMPSQEEAEHRVRSSEADMVSLRSDEERRALRSEPAADAATLRTGYRRFQDRMAQSPIWAGRFFHAVRAFGRGKVL